MVIEFVICFGLWFEEFDVFFVFFLGIVCEKFEDVFVFYGVGIDGVVLWFEVVGIDCLMEIGFVLGLMGVFLSNVVLVGWLVFVLVVELDL